MVFLFGSISPIRKIQVFAYSILNKMITRNANKLTGIRSWLAATKTTEDLTKAAASGADVVVLDLEDSVAMRNKNKMRIKYQQAIHDELFNDNTVYIRLNGTDCYEEMLQDISLWPFVEYQVSYF